MRAPAVLAALLVLAATACSDASGPSNGSNGTAQNSVAVNDNSFNPNSLTVATGATVLWTWNGGNPHNVTWVDAGAPSPSATQTGGTYQRAFNAAGTYAYYCTIHGSATSGMRGSITVQ